jgi:hypothetical protein
MLLEIQRNSIEMGSNDLYLIKKLKESGITYEKLESYLRKLFLAIKDTGNKKKNDLEKN